MGAPLHTTSQSSADFEQSVGPPEDSEHSTSNDLPEPCPLTVAELEVVERFLAKTLDELFNS
jgi:hypothetical protein